MTSSLLSGNRLLAFVVSLPFVASSRASNSVTKAAILCRIPAILNQVMQVTVTVTATTISLFTASFFNGLLLVLFSAPLVVPSSSVWRLICRLRWHC